MNKTKILATVGPATTNKETLRNMIKAGVDCVRLNFSHATFEFSDDIISKVRELNEEMGTNVAILIDTAGPEIRVGALREKEISFKLNDDITISKDDIIGDERCFCTNYKDFVNDIEVGKKIILNNGAVELTVKYRDNYNIYCSVTREGKIKPRSHVNVPGTNINIPFLSDYDKEVINYASKIKADYLAVSYIKTLADVLEINDMLISLND
ncbi:MAG TPA: pyruvate kinase, partial [Bacilli bacterium]|nr:pyruvate kinase [Bacilli bacterium]